MTKRANIKSKRNKKFGTKKRQIIDEKKIKQEFKDILLGIKYVGRSF